MDSVFFFFVTLLVFGLIGVILYKYRYELKRYLKDPKYGSSWEPSRKTILSRRIEDANAELDWLDDKESKKED